LGVSSLAAQGGLLYLAEAFDGLKRMNFHSLQDIVDQMLNEVSDRMLRGVLCSKSVPDPFRGFFGSGQEGWHRRRDAPSVIPELLYRDGAATTVKKYSSATGHSAPVPRWSYIKSVPRRVRIAAFFNPRVIMKAIVSSNAE